MKTNIEQHIFELLKQYDCVIITGLGGFLLNPKNAYINSISNTIHPPSKRISFNEKLIDNDGLLANYISHIEKISYEEACIEVLKFSRKSKLNLNRGKTITFNKIGELKQNSAQKIEFKCNSTFNFDKDSFGLVSFALPQKINTHYSKVQYAYTAAIIILLLCFAFISLNNHSSQASDFFGISPNLNTYSPRNQSVISEEIINKETPGIYNVQVSQVDFDLYKINGTNYHILTKKCFKLGFGRDVQIKIWRDEKNRLKREVCFLNVSETEYDDCYKIVNVYSQIQPIHNNKVMVLTKKGKMKEAMLVLEESHIDPYIIANSNPDDNKQSNENKEDTLQIKDIGSRFLNAINSLSHNNESKIKQPEVIISRDIKHVHIVVGSFSNKKNAEAFKNQLIKRGHLNSQIIGLNPNGLIRVAVNSFFNEDEAAKELVNIKKSLSSAWVLVETK